MLFSKLMQHTFVSLWLVSTAIFWPCAAYSQVPAPSLPAVALRFDDFFVTPIGPRGVLATDTLRRANGQTVTLVGYMVQQERPAAGRFMLAPRPVQMSEHADGDADDLPPATVLVYLDSSQQDWTLPHVRGLISLTGVLSVGRHEASDGRVSWLRLQLAPGAVRGVGPGEPSSPEGAAQAHVH